MAVIFITTGASGRHRFQGIELSLKIYYAWKIVPIGKPSTPNRYQEQTTSFLRNIVGIVERFSSIKYYQLTQFFSRHTSLSLVYCSMCNS